VIRRVLVQRNAHKTTQHQRVRQPPGNPALRPDALEVPDQQRPEIDARRQRRTPALGCIELRAPALDKLVEPLRFYQFIQTLIERMPRSGCQLRVRDPQTFLLLPLLARAHRHARILRIIPVHPIIFFVPRIQTCTTGCYGCLSSDFAFSISSSSSISFIAFSNASLSSLSFLAALERAALRLTILL